MRYISCDIEDNVAIVQINNPPVNELSVQVIKGLDKTLDLLSEINDINVVIITGKGRFFVPELTLRRLQRKNICISSKKRNIGQKKLPILITISLSFIRKVKSMEYVTRDDVKAVAPAQQTGGHCTPEKEENNL